MKPCSKILSLLAFVAVVILLTSCAGLSREEVDKKIKDLKSQDTATRSQAALALADGGDEAKRAVPVLAAMLRDPNAGVRTSAAFALRKIGTAEAARALEESRGKD